MYKKIISASLVFILSMGVVAWYEEIECSSDAVFSEYSCTQCFDGWSKSENSYIWFLSDEWINIWDDSRILYKEEQEYPEMVNLNVSNVEWSQTPTAEDFWEYTEDFNNLYSEDEEGYVLPAWDSVTWLKSKLSYAFKLEKNDVDLDGNIGLLVYPLISHVLEANWGMPSDESFEDSVHKECVLFKSDEAKDESVEVKKLPETWPAEFFILLILAMILWFGIMKFRTRS